MIKSLSTLKRKIFLSIIACAFAVLLVLSLTACGSKSLTEDDLIEMGFNVAVVFDYNGGAVNSVDKTKLRIKEGSKIPDPGSEKNQLDNPIRNGYSFKNFVTAKLNENGEALRDENGEIIPDKVWNFEKDIPDGDIVLYAQWWDNYKMVLHYGDEFSDSQTVSIYRSADGAPGALIAPNFNIDGYTVLDYYYDRDFTNIVESIPIIVDSSSFENSQDGLTLDIWCDALQGSYTVVRSAGDFKSFGETENIYLYNNITMPADSRAVTFPERYSGNFIGNGNKITDLKVELGSSSVNERNYGLFKTVSGGANITDVTFENIYMSINLYATLPEINIAFFAGQIDSGATVSDVVISGTVDYEVDAGFTSFDKITVNEFANISNGTVTNSKVEKMDIIGSAAVYTSDRSYAVYVKGPYTDGEIIPESVYAMAMRVGESSSYNSLRFRTIVKNPYYIIGYTVTTSRGNFCITVSNNNGIYLAEVTDSTTVYTSDNNVGVYFRSHSENNRVVLDELYGMQMRVNGAVTECNVSLITENPDGTYSVTTDSASYIITIQETNGRYTAVVQ